MDTVYVLCSDELGYWPEIHPRLSVDGSPHRFMELPGQGLLQRLQFLVVHA